ncbi:O-antigen ligase family protein [Patescibacteria group bacterium AH-259-L07]|nr:O-antigen ligase family protein [Patescibacteria group bacterium AH-259-L07]
MRIQRIANNTNNVWIIVGAFLLFHALSLLGYYVPPVETLVFLCIVTGTLILSIYKIEYGFLVLIFEFFAGHGGHLFEFFGLSLRFSLFLIIVLVWLYKKIKYVVKDHSLYIPAPPILILFLVFLFFIFTGVIRGMTYNEPIIAMKDFINYSYIFLVFPLVEVIKQKNIFKNIFTMSKAGIIGIAIVTITVFILFSTGIVEVHDSFYWWWRNTAVGKATFAGNDFYRIVSPAHLLILPLFLVVLSFLIDPPLGSYHRGQTKLKDKQIYKSPKRGVVDPKQRKQRLLLLLALASATILIINFSRAYFLGIGAGLLLLAYHIPWRRWLLFSLVVIMIMILEFGIIYGIVSGGNVSAGFGFFGERIQTVVSPEEELSSQTRMVILPHLIDKIKAQPVFGHGLGSTVTFIDPKTFEERTTFHLDWGYLEIITELGLITLLLYIGILSLIFYAGWQKIKTITQDIFGKRLTIGLLAGLVSVAVATLTGPFLFHPVGIFYVTLTTAIILKN